MPPQPTIAASSSSSALESKMTASTERSPIIAAASLRGSSPTPSVTGESRLLRSNLLGDPFVWIAQAGLFTFVAVLWRILVQHPAGIFTYHPAFNSVAVLLFTQGVLVLQPTKTASTKKTGLLLHQIFQYLALPALITGSFFIIYNKAIHSAKHFTSWHGRFGITTLILIFLQIFFGAFVVYAPLTARIGGSSFAKSLWKFHRASGYLLLALLVVTPLTAIQSDWVENNSSQGERAGLVVGLALVVGGVTGRVQVSKLGFTGRVR